MIRGLAIPANERSLDLGGFVETVTLHAIGAALRRQPDVRALAHHDSALLLGRQRANTLRLHIGPRGLMAEIDPPDTTYARDLASVIGRGDLTGFSFGFRVVEDRWSLDDGMPHRSIEDFELREVSPVTWPAYESTHAAMRAAQFSRRRENPNPTEVRTMLSPHEIRPPTAKEHTGPAQRALAEFLRRRAQAGPDFTMRCAYDQAGVPTVVSVARRRRGLRVEDASRRLREIETQMRRTR